MIFPNSDHYLPLDLTKFVADFVPKIHHQNYCWYHSKLYKSSQILLRLFMINSRSNNRVYLAGPASFAQTNISDNSLPRSHILNHRCRRDAEHPYSHAEQHVSLDSLNLSFDEIEKLSANPLIMSWVIVVVAHTILDILSKCLFYNSCLYWCGKVGGTYY